MANRNTEADSRHVSELPFVGQRTGDYLADAGFATQEELRRASRADLRDVPQVGQRTILRIAEWQRGGAP